MTRAKPESLLKPKLLAVSVAACFALNAAALRANPNGPTVVHGGVGFSGLGTSTLTITNQAGGNAIINWNGFSIGVNDLTRFQQFANLAVLNRVTGSEISSILGSLQSDGRVFLINPNGIVFGASARIDTAGLVASSLGLSDQDFLANRLRFTEVPGAGAVVNNGVIETTSGGRVYLVAPTVENNGLIQSPQGAIVLAAGKEVELVDAASPFVTVKVASAEQAVNLGTLVSNGGQIGMFGALVRNAGVIEAGGAVAGPGGEIRLVATKDLTLDAGSVVSANGTSGGKVLLQAEGGTNLVGGAVEAKGSSGSGGTIDALGVRVGVVGHGLIDASGDTGGGTVRVGGDFQGANGAIQNAERTYIGSDGVIRADAMTTGDGGRVIVWADGDTRFYGGISARGGAQGGKGGFVETSGKQVLEAFGWVNVAAPAGQGGTWLLDPDNITISPSVGLPDPGIGIDGQLLFTDLPGTTTMVGEGSIEAALAYGNAFGFFSVVQLQATNDITINGNITIDEPGALTLQAGNDIRFNSFNLTTNGNLTLVAAATGGTAVTGAITAVPGGGNISTNNGDFTATGLSVLLGSINTDGPGSGGGAVNVTANGGNIQTGAISTDGGWVALSAYGGVSVTGAINTSGTASGGASNGSVSIVANGDVSTQSITTRSLHPGNGAGGDVAIGTDTGSISVNGTIDTRGANGVDDFGNSSYYAGTSAGSVALGRSAQDGFTGNAITVNGNILASGGNGIAAGSIFSSTSHSGGDGGFVSFGGNCDGPCIYGPANGNFVVTGVIDTKGGNGGASLDSDNYAYSYGGQGGQVYGATAGSVLFGAIDARGGNGGANAGAFGENYGGDGGAVEIYSNSGSTTIGWIDTTGGVGGAGGVGDFTNADGGDGGDGGSIYSNSFNALTIGTVVARGGGGGNGGSTTNSGYGAIGGDGGGGGAINLYSNNSSISIIAIDTAGGAAGDGGSAYGGSANGGDGGDGGGVYLQSMTGTSITASIVTRGGRGGHGSTAGGNQQAEGEVGGDGGSINLYAYYGNVSVANFVDSSGGAGGNGGLANAGFGANDASGGDGGEAGYLYFYIPQGSVTIGTILARGGVGGAGGTATGGDPQSQIFTEAQGGDGGDGYSLYVYAAGTIATGSIDVSGGRGGAGGTAMDASGGDGGDAAYQVWMNSDASIQTGSILAHGGAGGVGGVAQTDQGDSSGGSGGSGGQVNLLAWGVSAGSVTSGAVDVSGGHGGNSGSVGTSSSVGGDGGWAGYISYYGGAINVKGPMLARGGNGGNMVNSGILSSLGGTPNGGAAGGGGQIYVWGTGEVQVNVGGAVGAVAMDVGGGMGGGGHPAASPAGNGGAGGSGGFVNVAGTPQMTLFGTLNATGGAGGAGGAGSASVIGGNGGAGGSAGGISLDASSVTGTQTGDGIIFVLAGATPFFDTSIAGGAGGAAGANGGAGGGTQGLAGLPSTFLSGSDYFGTIVILDPLALTEVNQGFQQIVEGNDDTTAFVGGEKEDEEEDKSQKELGSCQG